MGILRRTGKRLSYSASKQRVQDRDMTKLLDQAIARTQRLPEGEQNAIAALILDELDDEALWDRTFAASSDALVALAAEAMAEDGAGKTRPLDPDKL
jgi:hypothetical protein